MTLAQVLQQLDDYDDELMIWVRAQTKADLTADTEAIVAPELEDGVVWWEERGLSYVLEVGLAKDAIRVWQQDHAKAEPSAAQRCAAVIHYAVNDAFLEDDGGPADGPEVEGSATTSMGQQARRRLPWGRGGRPPADRGRPRANVAPGCGHGSQLGRCVRARPRSPSLVAACPRTRQFRSATHAR